MVNFAAQQPDPNDPEAIKKALLLKLFGGATPAPGTPPPGAPGTPPTTQPNASAAPASAPAQPLATAKPPTAKPLATPTAEEPGNQPPTPAPILSPEEFEKQNPAAPHTPYQAPNLKHRMLEGIFAGMQEFGRPGEGAATVRNYLGDIDKKTEEEKNYPTTSADAARKRYMDYVAGQKAPIDLEDLRAQVNERQQRAKDLAAQAAARANPPVKQEKNLQQMHAEAMQDALERGVDPATDPKVKQVEDAIQRIQKEPAGKTPNAKEAIQQQMSAEMAKPQPDHKLIHTLQQRLRDIDPLAEDRMREAENRAAASQQKEERQYTRKEVSDHDRTYVKPAEDIEKSYQMMDGAYRDYKAAKAQGKDLPTGAQSMLALSSHLTTTFGNVKGARITKEMIQEHLGARGISDSAHVAIQKLTNGDVLSPEQWEAFHGLIAGSRKLSWQTAVKEAGRKKIPVDFLPRDLGSLADQADGKSGQQGTGGDKNNPLGI